MYCTPRGHAERAGEGFPRASLIPNTPREPYHGPSRGPSKAPWTATPPRGDPHALHRRRKQLNHPDYRRRRLGRLWGAEARAGGGGAGGGVWVGGDVGGGKRTVCSKGRINERRSTRCSLLTAHRRVWFRTFLVTNVLKRTVRLPAAISPLPSFERNAQCLDPMFKTAHPI